MEFAVVKCDGSYSGEVDCAAVEHQLMSIVSVGMPLSAFAAWCSESILYDSSLGVGTPSLLLTIPCCVPIRRFAILVEFRFQEDGRVLVGDGNLGNRLR